MKFTYEWLCDFLQTDWNAERLADTLTLIGFEVEALADTAKDLQGFQVAAITNVSPHPDADRLRLCTIRHKTGTQQIVCGAPNVRVGLKSAFAPVGSVIPQSGMTLTAAKIRGVVSEGMLCSAHELGLGEDSDGILELPDTAKVGSPLAKAVGAEDIVFDVAITPNRGDCFGVIGIARELAAAGAGKFVLPKFPSLQKGKPLGRKIVIAPQAKSHCATFAGCAVRGVEVAPSPAWLARRLRAVGSGTQSAPVDITNYVALSFGHPMHVYDEDALQGDIVVRLAQDKEKLAGLDGQDYTLAKTDCVIADSKTSLGLGGVMGGQESACQATSKNLFLEAAWFAPEKIARTGQQHNCMSESRQRYERGVDKEMTQKVLHWAAKQIQDICGGEVSAVVVAGAKTPPPAKAVAFMPASIDKIAGQAIPPATSKKILTALGFAITAKGKAWRLRAPSWRYDISTDKIALQAELAEEVLRFAGLTALPSVALPAVPVRLPVVSLASKAKRVLAQRGLMEAVTWSFISPAQVKDFDGKEELRLANPLSQDLAYMRHSLLPNLLAVAQRNLARQNDLLFPLRLFEVGEVFSAQKAGAQRQELALLRGEADKNADDILPRLRDDIVAVALASGLAPDSLSFASGENAPAYYDPQQVFQLRHNKTTLGFLGQLHPRLKQKEKLRGQFGITEVWLNKFPQATKAQPYRVSNLPLVQRDFSFVCAPTITAEQLENIARQSDSAIVRAEVFDVFALADSAEKALALKIVLAPKDQTFTDEKIAAICDKVVRAIANTTKARLRA